MKFNFLRSKWVALTLVAAISVSCVSKKKYEEALTRAAAEKSALESTIAAAQEENDRLKAEAAKLQQNLNMSAEEIAQLSEKIKKGNQQLDQLKAAITEAFPNYDGITVEERNGKLYISMANAILFESGEAKIAKESKEVIVALADVFKKNTGLYVSVEGHTDNEPIKVRKDQYKDNWQLSVARSLAVVRELQAAGVDPNTLTASGKGDTAPIADNATEEGRDKNRRTEFVVSPKVDGLYRMYKSGFSGLGGSSSN
jgi:chemotaxis protein MotB